VGWCYAPAPATSSGPQQSESHRCWHRRSRSLARINPLLYALGAGAPGPSLVSDLDGELRRFALTEMNRTSMTTGTAALVAVSEFTWHEWIGQIDVPV
jgi:hypothetical protein